MNTIKNFITKVFGIKCWHEYVILDVTILSTNEDDQAYGMIQHKKCTKCGKTVDKLQPLITPISY